jgi:anti-sigma factor RsiW
MNRDTQLKVQAYLDNELSPGDARNVSKLISSDAFARELYHELKTTREVVSANEPEIQLPESRDFYWSQIQRRIAAAERQTAAAPARPWWLRIMAPALGTAALFALLLTVVDTNQPTNQQNPLVAPPSRTAAAPLHQVEEAAGVSTFTFRSEAEGVTLVWLSTQ